MKNPKSFWLAQNFGAFIVGAQSGQLGTCRNASLSLFSLELARRTEWDSHLLMTATTRLTNFAALNVYGPTCGHSRFLLAIMSDRKAKPKSRFYSDTSGTVLPDRHPSQRPRHRCLSKLVCRAVGLGLWSRKGNPSQALQVVFCIVFQKPIYIS